MKRLWHWIRASMVFIMLAGLLHPVSVAFAAGIVVNPGGGGNFTTIQAAINNASPGDSILIKTGTYTENLDLSLMGSAIGGTTGNLNLVAADGPGTATLSGSGVKLTNSGNYNGSLTIDGLRFSTTNEDGIRLTNVNNLVIVNSAFDPIGSDVAAHNGLELTLGSGTPNVVLYQNSFSNIANDAVSMVAQGTAQPTFTIVGNTITDTNTNANTTDQAIALTVQGTASARATIAGNTLTTLESRAVAIGVGNTAQLQASVVGNIINTITSVDQAITAETLNSATTASLDVTIADNTISNISSGLGIFVQMGGNTASPVTPSITAKILRNTLTNIGNNDFDRGIVVVPGISGNTNLDGTINVLIDSNQLSNIAASGLYVFADDSINLDATVRNNTFTNTVTFASANEAGFLFRTNNAAARLRLALTSNAATTATPGTNFKIRLLQQAGTFELEGNAALTAQQNVATANPSLADSITVNGTIGIIPPGTIVAPSENKPPVAVDDSATSNGAPATINVLANDTDPDSNPRQLKFFTPVSFRGGSVTRNDNGTPSNLSDDQLVYTSPAGFVGTDTLYYTTADTIGFTDAAKVTLTVTSPPTVTMSSAAPNPTNTSPIPVTVQFSQSVTGFTASDIVAGNATVDNFSGSGANYSFDLIPSGQGLVTADIAANVAQDGSGSGNLAATQFSRTYDSVAPTVTMSSVASDPTKTSPIPVTAQFSENVTGFTASDITTAFATVNNFVAVDGDTYTFNLTPAGQGLLTADIAAGVASDAAGNGNTVAVQFSRMYDSVAPDTTIDSDPSDLSNSSSASFTFSASEGGSTFECKLDGGAFSACTSAKSYTGLGDGSHTFEVRAVDAAGNTDATPASYTWTIDTTGPDTVIDSNPSNPSNSDSASFTFHATETGSTFECKLDGDSFASCTSPQNYTGLADGSHTFQVRATDSLGNTDASPASFTWTVDTAAPNTTIDSNPSNPSNSSSASFSFSGTDSGSGVASFECKLDGGSFAACTSPKTYSGLGDGSHTFEVRAIDGVGTADPTPASFTWTIDTIAPSVTINQASGQADPTTASPVHFTVAFDEPVTGFTSSDVTLSGTAGATTAVVTEIAPNDGTTYDVAVSGMTTDGTIIASISANQASDAAGNGNTASTSTDNTVTFIANQAPTANNDSYSTNEDTVLNPTTPGVLGNDTDPDNGDTLTAVLVSGPSHADSFTLNADGSFAYTPSANYNGSDSFTYKARDSKNAESGTATVSLTINAVNDQPSAANDSYTTDEDTTVSIPAPGLLSNDSDVDTGDTLTAVLVSNPSHGTLTLNSDGSFMYTPAANYNGSDSFTYKANDGTADSGVATVSITVNAVNDSPTAVADSYSTNEDTPLNVAAPGVLSNDTDPDAGDTRTAVLVSNPSHGTLTLNADGSFTYTPAANYNGADSFSYKARDGANADSSTVTVSINVNAVNDAPTVVVAAGGMCSASNISGVMNLTVADTDTAGSGLTLSASSSDTKLVPNANIVFGGSNASRTVSITPVPQKSSKTATVTITVNDGQGGTSTITIKVIVGTDKKETINGTSGADMIFGLNGDDTINAVAGNDVVCGGNGGGTISGGDGDDTLDGGNGNDVLNGGNGNDILRGNLGNDQLTGNAGADSFSGGPGTDTATDFNAAQGDTQDGTIP